MCETKNENSSTKQMTSITELGADREPPTIENCVDPPIFYTDRDDGHDNVTWDEPVFYDNSRATVLVDQSHRPGEDLFSFGCTRVYYNATDKYGNRASCVLNVTVKGVLSRYIFIP